MEYHWANLNVLGGFSQTYRTKYFSSLDEAKAVLNRLISIGEEKYYDINGK